MAFRLTVNNQPNTQKITINNRRNQPIQPKQYPAGGVPAPAKAPPVAPHAVTQPAPAVRLPVQGSGSSNYSRVTSDQLIAEAARQADLVRIAAYEQKQRIATAKQAEIASQQKGFLSGIEKKIGVSGFLNARHKREKAVQFFNQNNNEASLYIQAKQRQFEREASQRKADILKDPFSADFSKKVDAYNAWVDSQDKLVKGLVSSYTDSQTGLQQLAGKPIKGKLAGVISGTTKVVKVPLNAVAKTWDAFTYVASQPARIESTIKNLIKPNSVRTYYGGGQAQGGIKGKSLLDTIRNAYNASHNQQFVTRTKANEQNQLKPRTFTITDQNGSRRTVTWQPNLIHKVQAKYGDDVANFVLDPLMFLPAGQFSKATGKAGKTIADSKIFKKMADSKIGSAAKWLGAEYKPRSIKARDKVDQLLGQLDQTTQNYRLSKSAIFSTADGKKAALNKAKSDFLLRQGSKASHLVTSHGALVHNSVQLQRDFIKNLNDYSDKEVRAMTKWARDGSPMRGIAKARQAEIQRFVRDYQAKAKVMADAENLTHRAKNYLPDVIGNNYNPHARRSFFKHGYRGQTRQGLQQSLMVREFMSSYDGSNQFEQQLAAVEKSIKRNASKTKRGLTSFEQQKLDLLARRREQLRSLNQSHLSTVQDLQSQIDLTRKNSKGFAHNRSWRGARNTAVDTFNAPLNIWRKSVLKYRPAWYVNNLLWNIPASVSAGGARAIPEMAKLTFNPKYRAATRAAASLAHSKISNEVGTKGLATVANKIEDIPRAAAFLALKKKGYSDKRALKRVNDWLFDYSNKRGEQPLRHIFPFYNWSKGLTKLSLKMPFEYPRHAAVFSKAYQQFYQRPLNQLDNQNRTWVDPSTGQTITSNERLKYRGRLKIGNKWVRTPFNALTPEQLGQVNLNPMLTLAEQLRASKDRFGNLTTDRSIGTLFGEQFPQYKLVEDFVNRNKPNFQRWFTPSGYSKEAQGQDPSASNYKQNLDNKRKFGKSLGAFVGVPSVITRDPNAEAYRKRYNGFNAAYFKIDWSKRLTTLLEDDPNNAYKRWRDEQSALAQKFGFNFEKDIVHGDWTKYDTATTSHTKQLKEKARQFASQYWQEYAKLPKPVYIKTATGGYWSPSTSRPFWIGKYRDSGFKSTLADNPYASFPYFNKKDTAGKKTGKKDYIAPHDLLAKEQQSQVKRAAGAAKYALWQKYWNLGSYAEKQDFLKKHPELLAGKSPKGSQFQADGKFFKTAVSRDRYLAGTRKKAFWDAYFATSNYSERQRMLDAHPEYRKFSNPAQIGFNTFKSQRKNDLHTRARSIKGFSALEADILARAKTKAAIRNTPTRFKKVAFKLK